MPELVVGRIGRPHGIRGEVTVEVLTDSPDQRFAVDTVLRAATKANPGATLTVAAARNHSGRLLVTFAGVVGRDAAEALRGRMLAIDIAELPELEDDDEYYDHQLEGLQVELPDGSKVGKVKEILHGPAGDLLVVARPGDDDALVPFIKLMVPTVDVPGGRVVIDPPPGLLEDLDED
ncbi:ribosome maturation factor RimM [Pseudonocardiaceae bacterium YIM PH 21723]|nr:ribosome maturation factor RimM [Pseudonocardiaceae bacterium YIM PH 21723]